MIVASRGGRRLSIDQQLALRTAAVGLWREFQGVFDPEAIGQVLLACHDQVGGDSAITRFLRAEHFARQQLQARTRIQGHHTDQRPIVLFVDLRNACRAPMAVGFFHHLVDDRAIAWSGGARPSEQTSPAAVAAMYERGINIAAEFPKPWTTQIIHAADTVITLSRGTTCPILPDKRYLNWELDDATSQDVDTVRPIRDEIEQRVQTLVDELDIRSHP